MLENPSDQAFFDQGKKLRYLLHQRRDRREPDPKILNYVRHIDDDGKVKSVRRIETQAQLAFAIPVDPARVSEWMRGKRLIPAQALAVICRIYAVDDRAFRSLPFDDFVETLRTGISWPTWSRWRRLLDTSALPGLRYTTRDPAASWIDALEGTDSRHPSVPARDRVVLPEIRAETSFWLTLSSPQTEDGGWVWAGWHVLVLSRDCRTDSFAHLSGVLSASGTFPISATLYLPIGPGLEHASDDIGAFEITTVLTLEAVPTDIIMGLSAGDGQGPLIEPALDRLAIWLETAELGVAMRGLRYRVVTGHHDQAR